MDIGMRTTIDLPERDHRIFLSLARAQGTTLSKVVLELARRGLKAPLLVEEAKAPAYRINPLTSLPMFRSSRPITIDDVKALEDEC
jgi:hypothetical protein